MTEELNRFQRIKSLLQDTKLIDSHTISLVVAECDMALTQRPAAQAGEVELAFDQGWRMAAEWANRDDLIPDMDSPHYAKERSDRLASLPTQPAAQDEREADEVFLPRRLAATQKLTQLGYRYDSAHGKWLPAPQQATPEPDDAQRRFEAGCVVLEYLRDIGAPYRAVHHMLIALHGDPEAKSKATPEPVGWTDADADAARLAMELECLLLDTKDTAAVSRWWKSANEALDLHRARLAAAQAKGGV